MRKRKIRISSVVQTLDSDRVLNPKKKKKKIGYSKLKTQIIYWQPWSWNWIMYLLLFLLTKSKLYIFSLRIKKLFFINNLKSYYYVLNIKSKVDI